MKLTTTSALSQNYRRQSLLIVIVCQSPVSTSSLPPFARKMSYLNFADKRMLFGIPDFFDAASDPVILIVGSAGSRVLLKQDLPRTANAWIELFMGIALNDSDSAYYHLVDSLKAYLMLPEN